MEYTAFVATNLKIVVKKTYNRDKIESSYAVKYAVIFISQYSSKKIS